MSRTSGNGGPPTVSVALATYRGARYLPELLVSLGAQKRPPDELVVSDDASDDDTITILNDFAKSAEFPVRIIQQPRNIGVLENFYSAFLATTGDVIFYCDQDDFWEPSKIEAILPLFKDFDTHLVAHRSRVVDEALHGERLIPDNPRYGLLSFPVNSMSVYAHGHQMAFDRAVLHAMEVLRVHVPRTAPWMCNNLDVYIPFCASLLGSIFLSPESLVRFRRHSASVSPLAKEINQSKRLIYRMAASAEREARELAGRRALIDAALTALPEERDRLQLLRSCYDQQCRISCSSAAVSHGHFPLRLTRLIWAIVQIFSAATHFSNRRIFREAVMALACFVTARTHNGNKDRTFS